MKSIYTPYKNEINNVSANKLIVDLMRYYTQSIISVAINNRWQINGFKVIINIYTYHLYN